MIREAYLARHGQTQWNHDGRRQGRLDTPLTEQGEGHATALAAWVASVDIDGLFSSPLGRARTTAERCARSLGATVVVIDDLAEVDHGGMAGFTEAELEELFPVEVRSRADDKYRWRFPGGESYADAEVRARRALDVICQRAEQPLIVSHEMIGRMLLKQLSGITVDSALRRRQPHDLVLRVEPKSRSVEEIVLEVETLGR